MKLFRYLPLFFVFLSSPTYADRFEELKNAYGAIRTARLGLEKVGSKYPDLAKEAAQIDQELVASKVGVSYEGARAELKMLLGEEKFEEFEKEVETSILSASRLVPAEVESAQLMIKNIAQIKEGRLPTENLRTLISANPDYQKDPEKEVVDGMVSGFSTKLDPKEREVHFLLPYPGSWKPVDPDPQAQKRGQLFAADNLAGYGEARLTLDALVAPEMNYEELGPIRVAELLVPEGGKVLKATVAQLAEQPAAMLTVAFTPEGSEESNRIIAVSGLVKGHFVSVRISILPVDGVTPEQQVDQYEPLLRFMAEGLIVE